MVKKFSCTISPSCVKKSPQQNFHSPTRLTGFPPALNAIWKYLIVFEEHSNRNKNSKKCPTQPLHNTILKDVSGTLNLLLKEKSRVIIV